MIEVTARKPRKRAAGILSAFGLAVVLAVLPACEATESGGVERADATTVGEPADFGLVIHGGAGTILRENLTDEREAAYHSSLRAALDAGYEILDAGGTAMDAVIAAVMIMEDEPLFNAGRGAVFTSEGTNELDAAVMDGADRNAGAIAGVTNVKNPITLARLVMDESPHVMMAGEGAETFGAQFDIETVDPDYYFTEERWEALQRAREAEEVSLDWHTEENRMIGTVGAVARDRDGNLAAATSTGGMTNKRFGRIGDVPVIGAGTYASNESCAVSATGHGEYFIRNVVSREICARMEHRGESLQEAAEAVVLGRLFDHGGTGGIVAVDLDGRFSMVLNTPGMYRGHYMAGAEPFTAIYADEGDGR
jgi:L-asparaginase / beta-aspartyl-peptidase